MACNSCIGGLFKDKLGRCNQCMGLNLIVLIVAVIFYCMVDISTWIAVQQVAFLMFMWGTGSLMLLHIIAWFVYRLKR